MNPARTASIAGALLLLSALVGPASSDWTPVQSPEGDSIENFFNLEGDLYVGTLFGQVYTSTDHGDSWERVGTGLPEEYAPVTALQRVGDWLIVSRSLGSSLAYRVQWDGDSWGTWQAVPFLDDVIYSTTVIGESIFAVMDGLPYRSDDYGLNWIPISPHGAVRSVFSAADVLFAAEGTINVPGMYRSEDLGQTWEPIGSELGSSYLLCETFFDDLLWVSVYHNGGVGSLWYTHDFGDSWHESLTLPGQTNINGFVDTPAGPVIGASGDMPGGVSIYLWLSWQSWAEFVDGLPEAAHPVDELVGHDNFLFKTGGVTTPYRAAQWGAPTSVDANTSLSEGITFRPNPASDGTEIHFSATKLGPITLRIHDVLGRQVRDLSLLARGARSGSVYWDGRNDAGKELAAGLYLVRFESGERSQLGKIWLAR